MSAWRFFRILLALQARRGWNQLQSWRLRLGWPLYVGTCMAALALIGIHLVLGSYVHRLLDAAAMQQVFQDVGLRFTLYEDVSDQAARLMIVFLSSTLLSALFLKWGHWQSLERDADWEWFAQQPLPPLTVFIQRCLVESLWPQGLTLFILPFFIMLAWSRGWELLPAIAGSIALLICLQALLAAPRMCFDLWLRTRWTALHVRTLRGILGLFGAGLLVLGMQSLSVDASWAVPAVIQGGEWWDRTPAALAVRAMILSDHWTGFVHFLWLLALVVAVHAMAYTWAAAVLGRAHPEQENPSGRLQETPEPGARWITRLWQNLHPLTRRDLRLLGRDRHFLLQIIVGPLLFAIIPLEMLDQVWSGTSVAMLLSMAFIAGFLFLMGAVFQLLPMEGRSLWMIFTWPESLSRFVGRRLTLLIGLAAFYAGLVLLLGILRHGFSLQDEGWRVLYLFWGLCCLAVILAATAVRAYRPGREGREHRPGWLTTLGLLFLGGLTNGFMFRPEWQSLGMLLMLTGLALVLWGRMKEALPRLLDLH